MCIKLAILFATLAYVSAGHLESPLQVPLYTTTPVTYGAYGTSAQAISYSGHPALTYGNNNYVPTLPYGHSYGYSPIAQLTTYPAMAAPRGGYGYANHVSHGSAYGHYAY
ncbi:hypothetical protein quinque_006868 [Culex quinquefasciatus]